MEIFPYRKGHGVQLNIWAKHWRIAIAFFCCKKVIGLLPCTMCNKRLCKYEDE